VLFVDWSKGGNHFRRRRKYGASFYHLMFRDETADAMQGGKIRWALRRINYAFGEEFTYYNRANNRQGYEIVDVKKE
jgi:hypothetical protein